MKIHSTKLVRLVIAAAFLCLAVAFTAAPAAPPTPSKSNGDLSSDASDLPARTAWKKQEPIPTPWGLYDVDMISATEGWAVAHPITGDHANIFHTTNGGKNVETAGRSFQPA